MTNTQILPPVKTRPPMKPGWASLRRAEVLHGVSLGQRLHTARQSVRMPAKPESFTQCASCVTPDKHLSELQFSDPKNGHNDNTYLAGLSRGSNEKHIKNWHSVPNPWRCSGNGVLVILSVGVSIDCCVSAVKSFGEPVTSKCHRCSRSMGWKLATRANTMREKTCTWGLEQEQVLWSLLGQQASQGKWNEFLTFSFRVRKQDWHWTPPGHNLVPFLPYLSKGCCELLWETFIILAPSLPSFLLYFLH